MCQVLNCENGGYRMYLAVKVVSYFQSAKKKWTMVY